MGRRAKCIDGINLSRSITWQDKIYQICQEIRNIKHQTRNREKHILDKETPKIYYRGKTVSLDTHVGNATGGVYSDYSTPPETGSDRSSGNPEHYDIPIYDASPTPPSEPPKLEAPPYTSSNSWKLDIRAILRRWTREGLQRCPEPVPLVLRERPW